MPNPGTPNRWVLIAAVLSVGAAMAACSRDSATAEAPPAAVVETASGSEPVITLAEVGAARIGVQTTAVAAQSPVQVPYRALMYDPSGATWVYVSPEPLTYQRFPVTVADIDGDLVHLVSGPPPGTEVVTVGVAELWGAENGIGQ